MKDVNKQMRKLTKNIGRFFVQGADIADIDRIIHELIKKNKGITPSMLGYHGFPNATSIAVNDHICHAVPHSYKLQRGDIVTLDLCLFNGKTHSDWAHTFIVGGVNKKYGYLVEATRKCLVNAIAFCAPGKYYEEIGDIVSKTAAKYNCRVVKNLGGHGIGTELHMKPHISNERKIPNTNIMKVGDTFTIEPLLTVAKTGDTRLHKDGFTIMTIDKSPAAHFERTLRITRRGCKILN